MSQATVPFQAEEVVACQDWRLNILRYSDMHNYLGSFLLPPQFPVSLPSKFFYLGLSFTVTFASLVLHPYLTGSTTITHSTHSQTSTINLLLYVVAGVTVGAGFGR